MEVSGTVVAMAADVKQWQLGDQVCALVTGGGYAEYCAAPADNCMPIPQGISLVDAAALPETFMTVWSNVWDRARLAPGESLLIQGGSSGIGVTAIQMAKALGHKVYTTAGSDEKCAACEQLGADRAINYRNSDFVAEVLKLTDGRGVNVVLDMVAGDYVQREIQCLADDGRLALGNLLRERQRHGRAERTGRQRLHPPGRDRRDGRHCEHGPEPEGERRQAAAWQLCVHPGIVAAGTPAFATAHDPPWSHLATSVL
jgi:NADPH2:quinone reductase